MSDELEDENNGRAPQKDEAVSEALIRYAQAAGSKVFTTQAELDPKDRPHPELAEWCLQRRDIIVLKSGMILSSDPTSRHIQNCKTMMINRGIRPGKVCAAVPSLLSMLLANIAGSEEHASLAEKQRAEKTISSQQKRLRLLIKEAVDADVSDIHIEVREDVSKIRFRKYGELYLHAEWFPRLGREVASVAFNKETDHATAHFNPLVPQDASMPLFFEGKEIRLRLASMPAHGGFDVVMRILGTGGEAKKIGLDELGYTPEQVYMIRRAVNMPHGAVLLSGPTGSGKTTTLASCMQMVRSSRKVYTIEDPVEKVVASVTQVPVNTEKDDRSFASFGRAALRMDPDYIVLGEMRDEDTANVMIRAAITGHLVFSTVHTNSATGIISRLVDMGISPTMLGDSNLLVCLIFQRLVPQLCDDCAVPVSEAPAHKESLDRWRAVFTDSFDKLRARGETKCQSCHNSGLKGRTVVAEVIWVDEQGRKFVKNCDSLGWEKYLRSKGWQNYSDRTLELVCESQVDPFDAEALIGELTIRSEDEGFDYLQARKDMLEEMQRKANKKSADDAQPEG